METSLNRGESQEGKLLDHNTNEVLVQEKKTRTVYYLPCYIRFKVKEVCEVKIDKLLGVISGTLLFSFYYGDLPRQIVEQFTGENQEKAILLQSKESIQLREEKGITFKEDASNKIIDYVVRTEFDCHLKGDVFLTPFQIVNLCMSITVQSVVLDPKRNNGRRIDIKFNCMNSEKVTVIDHGQNIQFGNYRLADYFLDCDYYNSATSRFKPISTLNPDQRICKSTPDSQNKQFRARALIKVKHQPIQQSQLTNAKCLDSATPLQAKKVQQVAKTKEKGENEGKVQHYQYVHFRIPLYKYPGSNLLSIFLPLWVLSFINLTIYFQDTSFAGRLAVIATITLAFIAFLPTINQKIPQSSVIKLVQILIYLETASTILTIIESLTVKDNDSSWSFVWNQSPYFVITLIINVIAAGLIVVLFGLHKLFWQKVYLRRKESKISQRLIKQDWENKECDQYFKEYLTSNQITYFEPSFPRIKIKP